MSATIDEMHYLIGVLKAVFLSLLGALYHDTRIDVGQTVGNVLTDILDDFADAIDVGCDIECAFRYLFRG